MIFFSKNVEVNPSTTRLHSIEKHSAFSKLFFPCGNPRYTSFADGRKNTEREKEKDEAKEREVS